MKRNQRQDRAFRHNADAIEDQSQDAHEFAGGVADELVTQLVRRGDTKVFKKYSQMKLQVKSGRFRRSQVVVLIARRTSRRELWERAE